MPGATTSPSASIVSCASSATSPTATIRPSRIPTSARREAAPVPSTTVPPLITQSSISSSYEPASPNHPGGGCATPVRREDELFRGAFGGVERFAAAGRGRLLGLALAPLGLTPLGLVGLPLLEHLGAFGVVALRGACDQTEA